MSSPIVFLFRFLVFKPFCILLLIEAALSANFSRVRQSFSPIPASFCLPFVTTLLMTLFEVQLVSSFIEAALERQLDSFVRHPYLHVLVYQSHTGQLLFTLGHNLELMTLIEEL